MKISIRSAFDLSLALSLAACLGCGRTNPDQSLDAAPSDAASSADAGQPTPAMLTMDDSSFQFNPVADAPKSALHTFTVTNRGGTASGALETSIEGNGFAAFAVVDDGCAGKPLAPSGECHVSVVLTSATAGTFEATLRVHGDPGGIARSDLSGIVVEAGLGFDLPGVDFGTLVQEEKSMTLPLTLKNGGGARSGAISLTASDSSVAIVSDGCSGKTLDGGASCAVTVQYTAGFDAVGAAKGTLIAMSGPGGVAVATTLVNVLTEATLSAPDYDFGEVGYYYGHASHDITVTNIGHTAATVTKVESSAAETPITADHCSGSHLAPNDTCVVTVAITPGHGAPGNLTFSVDHGHGMTVHLTATIYKDAVTLSLDLIGDGGGTVTAMDNQVCDGSKKKYCFLLFPLDTTSITLTAAPDASSSFFEWSGGECDDVGKPTCFLQVSLSGDVPPISAYFKKR